MVAREVMCMQPTKLGIVGKGGVGKTTAAGLLARTYAAQGRRVVAVDTDSNPNLGQALGLSLEQTEAVAPLPRNLISGALGPTPEQLLVTYGTVTPSGATLLSAMKVAEAGAGCSCGGHATVRGLLGDTLGSVDVTVVDMEAGLEHLSRSGGTLAYADLLLAVCDPSLKSVTAAGRTATLARELGISHLLVLGNKARGADDVDFLSSAVADIGLDLVGVLPESPEVAAADRVDAAGLVPVSGEVQQVLDDVVHAIDRALDGSTPWGALTVAGTAGASAVAGGD
jgi:CO dehydrogenase maturation factor